MEGMDARLYPLVGPLVMEPDILKQNNNYPFKTSGDYVWYIAMEGKKVAGFMPVRKEGTGLYIDNYYVKGDCEETVRALLQSIVADAGTDGLLTALVHKRHVDTFLRNGFQVTRTLSLYDKMKYVRS